MRKPSVTRTVNFYEKTVKVYKKSTDEVLTLKVTTDKDTDKAARNALPEDCSMITVISTEKKQGVYRISLDDFLKYAEEITPEEADETESEAN